MATTIKITTRSNEMEIKWDYRNRWETRTKINDYSIGVNRYEYDNTYWIDWYQLSNHNNYETEMPMPKNINTLKEAKKFALKYYENTIKQGMA